MRYFYLAIIALLFGCATLGFGDFEIDEQLNDNEFEVKFIYQPLIGGKHNIFLAGDFNDWSETATRMKENDGLYEITLNLKPGKYGYKFLVDGKWIIDENVDEYEDDGYGGQNSVIYVGNKKEINALRIVDFTYKPKKIVKEVYLVGTMNDWNLKSHRMIVSSKGVYTFKLLLDPGQYHYKYLDYCLPKSSHHIFLN